MSKILKTQCEDSNIAITMDDLSYPHCVWVDGDEVKYARFYGDEWRVSDGDATVFMSTDVSLSDRGIGIGENGECFFVVLDGQDLKMLSWDGIQWTTETAWENAGNQDVLSWAVTWAGFPVLTVFTRSYGNKSIWVTDKWAGTWSNPERVVVPKQDNDTVEVRVTMVSNVAYFFWNGKDLESGESWIGMAYWDTNARTLSSPTGNKILLSVANGDISGIDSVSGATLPGVYLSWVLKGSKGNTQVHGCRVYQAFEYPIPVGGPSDSRIDSYEPSAEMASDSGFSPFYPSTSIYLDSFLNPKIVCLSTGLEMFSIEGGNIEEKSLGEDLIVRPSKIVSKGFLGGKSISSCIKMIDGNIHFSSTPETADMSSSSSSISSTSSSSISSASSVSSMTMSSISSMTMSSVSSESSASSVSSESSMTVSSVSSESSASSSSTESSISSMTVSSESSISSESSSIIKNSFCIQDFSVDTDLNGTYYNNGETYNSRTVYTNGTYKMWWYSDVSWSNWRISVDTGDSPGLALQDAFVATPITISPDAAPGTYSSVPDYPDAGVISAGAC